MHDGVLRQHPPNLVRLIVIGAAHIFPDLLLTRLVGRNRERHQLFEGHAILDHGRSAFTLPDVAAKPERLAKSEPALSGKTVLDNGTP
jgi:hypothetical protein